MKNMKELGTAFAELTEELDESINRLSVLCALVMCKCHDIKASGKRLRRKERTLLFEVIDRAEQVGLDTGASGYLDWVCMGMSQDERNQLATHIEEEKLKPLVDARDTIRFVQNCKKDGDRGVIAHLNYRLVYGHDSTDEDCNSKIEELRSAIARRGFRELGFAQERGCWCLLVEHKARPAELSGLLRDAWRGI